MMTKHVLRFVLLSGMLVFVAGNRHDSVTLAQTAVPTRSSVNSIAFVSNRDGYSTLYLMHSDGAGQHPLFTSPHEIYFPNWSPDGKHLAFERHIRGKDSTLISSEIHIVNADGTGEVNITPALNGKIYAGYPVWSPDGQHIAFQIFADKPGGPHRGSNIYMIRRDKTGLRQLTHELPGGGGCYAPAWLPDNIHLVTTCTSLMHDWLLLLNSADGSQKTLLDDAADPDGLRVALDGKQAAFIGAWGLEVILIGESQTARLIRLPTEDIYPLMFAWSPVEKNEIAVQTCHNLYLMNVVTERVKTLTTVPAATANEQGCYLGYGTPLAWSPNGKQIVFFGIQTVMQKQKLDINLEMYRYDFEGDTVTRLTNNNANDDYPTWRPG
jgi:Tol biopolymer transport system component